MGRNALMLRVKRKIYMEWILRAKVSVRDEGKALEIDL